MRKSIFLLLLVSFTLSSMAQNKDDMKKWKALAKEYKKDPLKLKNAIENYEDRISDLEYDLDEADDKLNDQKNTVSNLRADLEGKNARIAELEAQIAEMNYVTEPGMDNPMANDLIFYVQIGAYKLFNINHYFEGIRCMNVALDDDMNKYIIGSFNGLAEAENFRNDIRKMGIEDAWVVPMLNGERLRMEDALQLMEGGLSMFLRY